MRNDDLKDLAESFAEIEKRVQALTSENYVLRKRISGLEGELATARHEAQQVEHVHGKHLHIRERVERVLSTLDALGVKEKETGNSGRDAG